MVHVWGWEHYDWKDMNSTTTSFTTIILNGSLSVIAASTSVYTRGECVWATSSRSAKQQYTIVALPMSQGRRPIVNKLFARYVTYIKLCAQNMPYYIIYICDKYLIDILILNTLLYNNMWEQMKVGSIVWLGEVVGNTEINGRLNLQELRLPTFL